MLTESVRIYVIRPPSYSFCASTIVRCGENPHTELAACWSVDVVNGGYGWRVLGCSFTSETRSVAPARSATAAFAAPSSCISGFAPSMRASFALNETPSFRASTPSIQYGTGTNDLISRSRSTSSLNATDCTRPADRNLPYDRYFHSIGDTWNPTSLSRIRRACWASTLAMSMSRGFSTAA